MFCMRYIHGRFRADVNRAATSCRRRPECRNGLNRAISSAPCSKGLDVLAILAAHPAGMTLTEMAAAAGLTRAGARRLLLTLVGDRLSPRRTAGASCCRRGCSALPGNGSTAPRCGPSPSRIMREVAAAAEGILLGRGAVRRGCRLCRPRARRAHHERRAACRHAAAGLLHLDGPRAAVRACARPSSQNSSTAQRSSRRTEKTVTDRARASRPDRQGRRARLCRGRRGTGDRPALDRRADPRPRRQDRRGDQRLDAVGPLHRRRDAREILPLLQRAAGEIEAFFAVQ